MTPHPGAGLPATFSIDPRLLNLPEGLRSGLAIASVIVLAEWVHLPGLVWAALAAWLACLVDPGGPLRVRLRAQLLFGGIGAAITMGFGVLLAVLPLPVMVVLGAAVVFALSLLRVLGPGGVQLGTLLSVVLVLALRSALTDLPAAGIAGALFLAGALWAMLLTALLWRIHPFQTSRGAVAGCWLALGRLNDDLRAMVATPAGATADWVRHARQHRRDVRLVLEDARGRILAQAAELRDAAWRLDPSWQRLEAAEQAFDALVALGDVLEQDEAPPTRAAAARLLEALGPLLRDLAQDPATNRAVGFAPQVALLAQAAAAPGCAALRPIVARLLEGLDAAPAQAASWRDTSIATAAGGWRAIGAQLRRDALLLRHALRVAVAAAAGIAAMLLWPAEHDYWLTIALLVTLQPDVATTMARAAERIGGTLLGAMVGAGIAMLLPSPMAMALAVLALAVPTAALRRVSFGIFVAGVSAVVVVLLEIDHPGQAEALRVAAQRAFYTLAGGALALICSVLLWPDWAGARLEAALRVALATVLRYAGLAVAQLRGEADEVAMLEVRRTVGQTSALAEDLLQRTLLEQGRSGSAALGAALGVDAAIRRAGGRIASLRLTTDRVDRAAGQAWRGWFDAAGAAVAAGQPNLPAPPGIETVPALDEIGRHCVMAAEGLERLSRRADGS
ncbi:FUSC family protein [Roseomonas sp. CAU 1739]|uniref:FUSC family protein n=1 Tax=Roseomonas sp. CAU 1739 TaxID=3140364 RepID=UPI00325B56D0